VLTPLLVPADFGVVAAGLTVIAYLEVTLDLGMSAAVVYQQERGQSRSVAVAFTTNLTLCTVLAVLNFLAAPAVASFFRVPDSPTIFRALSIYILMRGVGALQTLQTALLQRDLRFREKAAADVTRALVRGGLGVVLARPSAAYKPGR
jgi:O-antigen/teichoic acid export membrane protein